MKKNDILESLSEDDYQTIKKESIDRLEKLRNGELVINRSLDYLNAIKSSIQKALKANYSYSDIATVIRNEEKGIVFSPREIKKFCEENFIVKIEKTTRKKSTIDSDSTEPKEQKLAINSDAHIDDAEDL